MFNVYMYTVYMYWLCMTTPKAVMRAQLFSLFQHNDVISLSNVLVCVLTFVLWVNPGLMGVVCA